MNNRTPITRRAPIEVRRSGDIFSGDAGLVRASLHFSFAGHIDPDNSGIGKLEVFNHDTLIPGSIWPMHYHQNIEAVTYVLKGEFEHLDSLGNGGVLLPGGVQVMTLGSGAEHSERNHSTEKELQLVQMWIIPEKLYLPPALQQRQYTEEDRRNRLLRIARPAGSGGEGLEVNQDASVYVSQLEDGETLTHIVAPGHGGYVYLIQGRMDLNGRRLSSGDAAYLWGDGAIELSAATTSELLLVETKL